MDKAYKQLGISHTQSKVGILYCYKINSLEGVFQVRTTITPILMYKNLNFSKLEVFQPFGKERPIKKSFSCFSTKNMCCGYSKDLSHLREQSDLGPNCLQCRLPN